MMIFVNDSIFFFAYKIIYFIPNFFNSLFISFFYLILVIVFNLHFYDIFLLALLKQLYFFTAINFFQFQLQYFEAELNI